MTGRILMNRWTKYVSITSGDMNDYTDGGVYYLVNAETGIENSPGPWFNVYCFPSGWGVVQVAIKSDGSVMKIRAREDNVWKGWKKVTMT